MQEAVLDLAVEQALSPVLRRVNESFITVMLEQGIPIEAILTELFLSGEVERTYRLVRLEGGAALRHRPWKVIIVRADRVQRLQAPAKVFLFIADGNDDTDGKQRLCALASGEDSRT